MSVSILEHFKQLPDPRVDRTKRYPLMEIILLFIAATISDCEGWKQIKDFGDIKLWWLRKYLPYQQGIPVDDTLARTICRLDTKAFQLCFMNWMKSVAQATENDIVAIDGKTLRRSYNAKDDKAAIHMVSIPRLRLVLNESACLQHLTTTCGQPLWNKYFRCGCPGLINELNSNRLSKSSSQMRQS